MALIVNGLSWNGPIPYKIGRAVRNNKALHDRLLTAIAKITSETHVRMEYRKSQRDYVLFRLWKGKSGNEGNSSDIGNEKRVLFVFGGGRQEIELGKNADVSVIMHEICHAIGLFHEHQRRDRDAHVRVLWSRIDPDKKDNFRKKGWRSATAHGPYDANSIMHYDGNEFGMYDWSEGWTSTAFVSVNDSVLLLILKRGSGHINVHKMTGAVVGERIQSRDWTEGYSSMCPFSIRVGDGQRHYVLFLKAKSGVLKIHHLDEAGIGVNVLSDKWSSGWVHAKCWQALSGTYLVSQNTSGLTRSHRMNADGTVGRVVYESAWRVRRWSAFEPFCTTQSNGSRRWFLFCMSSRSGSVRIFELNEDGSVGSQVDERRWTEGWTSVRFYEDQGSTYLIMLKAGSGRIHLHSVKPDGSVGPRTHERNWTSGYTNLAVHAPSGSKSPYFFILKTKNGHGHIHFLSRGMISSRASPPTMVSKHAIRLGGRELSVGDKNALNLLVR